MEQDVLLIRDNAISYHGRNSVYRRLGSELYDVKLRCDSNRQDFIDLKSKYFPFLVCFIHHSIQTAHRDDLL